MINVFFSALKQDEAIVYHPFPLLFKLFKIWKTYILQDRQILIYIWRWCDGLPLKPKRAKSKSIVTKIKVGLSHITVSVYKTHLAAKKKENVQGKKCLGKIQTLT